MITTEGRVKLQAPPALRERAVVRVVDKSFGPNSKDNPMVTVQWELCGFPQPDGSLSTTIKRGGQTYQVGGLRTNSTYLTLTPKAIGFYSDLWEKAHPGEPFPGVDETNPDIGWLDGLTLQAVISSESLPTRKILSEDEKEALKAAGKPIMGEPLTDEDGKPITRDSIKIEQFLKKYTGEVAPF